MVERWFPHRLIQTIYNGQPVPPAEDIHRGTSGQVIWVNNLKRWKRPEIFVQLAHRLPDYRFVMIGGMAEGRFGQMMQRAFEQAPANFTYLGSQSIDTVNDLIRQSDLLLYTSLPSEGFGNSFLQAWFREVPTVSLSFDPDGIIEREQVGRCSRTFEQLVTDVRELMEHEPLRREMGRRARAYAREHHSLSTLIAAYEQLFYAVVQQRDIAQEIVI
jgi:glycosyltransferase involved in cell wall biosynthesis